MIRLGGPVFIDTSHAAGAGESHGASATDPDVLVRAHQAKGYRAAYAPNITIDQGDLVRDMRSAFERADIAIAEVGYWKNPLHLDDSVRAQCREETIRSLALAEELNACCMVTNLGSFVSDTNKFHDGRNFTGEAFDAAIENARAAIDAVKPTRTFFSYEMYPFTLADTPEAVRDLIDAVDRSAFGVHMDLVNLVNTARAYYRSGAIMRRCVELFGHRILSAHAKDIAMDMPSISVILREVPPGRGHLDYRAYLQCLHALPRDVPLMMEHMKSEAEYDAAGEHIRGVAAQENIPL